jgi:hypothetical protein
MVVGSIEEMVAAVFGRNKSLENDFYSFLEFSNYYSMAAAFEEWKGLKIAAMIGQSVRILTKEEPQPFYFLITGAAKNGSSIVGHDDEGQKMLIKTADILEVRN